MKYILLIVVFFVWSSCKLVSQYSSKRTPISCSVLSLSWFSHRPIAISCDMILSENFNGKDLRVITNRDRLHNLYAILADLKNYEYLSGYKNGLDVKVRLDFKFANGVEKHFCVSRTGLIEWNGRVYRYNEKISETLIANKLIMVKR